MVLYVSVGHDFIINFLLGYASDSQRISKNLKESSDN